MSEAGSEPLAASSRVASMLLSGPAIDSCGRHPGSRRSLHQITATFDEQCWEILERIGAATESRSNSAAAVVGNTGDRNVLQVLRCHEIPQGDMRLALSDLLTHPRR
jgi:hypothetical protein